MDWADYLRDEAAKYRQETAEDLSIKQELLDLAAVVRGQPITSRIACRAANHGHAQSASRAIWRARSAAPLDEHLDLLAPSLYLCELIHLFGERCMLSKSTRPLPRVAVNAGC